MAKGKRKNYYEKSYEGCITAQEHQEQFEKNERMNWKFFTRGLAVVAAFGIELGLIYASSKISVNDLKKSFADERDDVSVLIISDGLVTVNNYATKASYIPGFHNSINNVEYEISYYEDRYLVIYAYGEDEVDRKSVVDYIKSTIEIKENNVVNFDPNGLNEEDYKAYINSVIQNNEQSVQRTRTEN